MKVYAIIAFTLISLIFVHHLSISKATGIAFPLFFQQISPNILPTANFTYSPTNPVVNQTVHFYDHSYETNGNIILWEWDFGDGTNANATTLGGANKTHMYTVGGGYTVSLNVSDAQGNADSVQSVIYVQKINTSLSLNPPESTNQGNEFVLNATLTEENGAHVSTAVEIFFYINDSQGDNILIGSTYTDSSGRASIYYTPQSPGSIEAVFNGTTVYNGASSNIQVLNFGANIIPYVVLASVAILLMSAVIAYLQWKSRKSTEEKEPSKAVKGKGKE
jgi:PKD repeat protein